MKILLATDGSASSAVAVDEVARRIWPEDSQLRIISVVEPHAPLAPGPFLSAPYQEEVEKVARARRPKKRSHAPARPCSKRAARWR